VAHRCHSTSAKPLALAAVVATAFVATNSAGAAQLKLPGDDAIDYSVLTARPIQLGTAQDSGPAKTERPLSDLVGNKLGFADGQLQLFRFRLDKAPFDSTLPRQQIDAGGIKLKWTW